MDSIMTENNTFLELMLHLRTLTNQHSLLVGGCVRDLRLGRQPKDLDIVTDANLDEVSKVLSENGWSIDEAGKQFFVLIASKNGQQFEIALFRKDGTYTDGRRPDFVQVGTMEEDALRRDFTINSLYSLACFLIDKEWRVWKFRYKTDNPLKSSTDTQNLKQRTQGNIIYFARFYSFNCNDGYPRLIRKFLLRKTTAKSYSLNPLAYFLNNTLI